MDDQAPADWAGVRSCRTSKRKVPLPAFAIHHQAADQRFNDAVAHLT
jgi:hypothetical protein